MDDKKRIFICECRSVNVSVEELTTQFNCAIKSCWGAVSDDELLNVEKEDLKAIVKKVAFYLDLE